jgi:hypothetical protein
MCAAAVTALSIAHPGYLFPQMRGHIALGSAEESVILMEAKKQPIIV